MTALAGYWSWGREADPAASCRRMLNAQKLYGPDDQRSVAADQIALGRTLFRLLPEDSFDRQPVHGGHGDVLVADVRLDNRDELATAIGIDPRPLCDADLLMRALERWQDEALDRLVGDFAFALWSPRRQRLLLARDPLGQRPLVYHRGSRFFAFASMPKGLHALPSVPYAPDRQMMVELTATLPEAGSRTFFEGIHRVAPGHVAIVTSVGVEQRRYWSPSLEPLRLPSAESYAEALRERFDAAVAPRLRTTAGAVGAQLSAGLDSSAVTATAARLLAGGETRLIAFTAVPRPSYAAPHLSEAITDEGPLAKATAALHPNIEHLRVSAAVASPLDALDRSFFLYERPILNISNLAWTNAINAAARERGVSVMLNGRLGNLSFSWSGMDVLPRLLKTGRLTSLARHVAGLRSGGMRWGTIGARALGPFIPRAAWNRIRSLRGGPRPLLNPALAPQVAAAARGNGFDLDYRPSANSGSIRLAALGRVDFGNYNKGSLAEWGMDYRDPTADRRLVEFCLRVPPEEYLRGGIPRALARRAFADRLPPEVVQERRKGYQAADWHEGFDAARDAVTAEVERIAGCQPALDTLDIDRMKSLIADWPSESWHDPRTMANYRVALLRGISNGHFLRRASGANQ